MPIGHLRMRLVARGTNHMTGSLELSVPLRHEESGWRWNLLPMTNNLISSAHVEAPRSFPTPCPMHVFHLAVPE